MLLEALGSALLGLALALAAVRRLRDRLPSHSLVLPTGAVGGLFGGFVAHTVLGPGHAIGTLAGAVAVAAALLSLLLRSDSGVRRPSATA